MGRRAVDQYQTRQEFRETAGRATSRLSISVGAMFCELKISPGVPHEPGTETIVLRYTRPF